MISRTFKRPDLRVSAASEYLPPRMSGAVADAVLECRD
jgi:hypothetical protein